MAGRIETMPDDLFEDVKEAIDAYERETDEMEVGTNAVADA